MTQWFLSQTACIDTDLSLLGAIPFELNPRWLVTQVDPPKKRIELFLIGDSQQPSGYAPFLVHPGALDYYLGEIMLFSLPVERYAMRAAPLCKADELAGLFEVLHDRVGRRGVAFFEGVRTGSTLSNILTEKGSPVHSYFHIIPYGPVYSRRLIELPVSSTFEDYLATLGNSVRQDIRRTRRNLKAKHGSDVHTIRYDRPEQMESLADAIAHVSRKTYQSRLLDIGLDNTPEQVKKLIAAANGGWLRAYVLWMKNTPIAFRLGYCANGIYYSHHIGYDPSLRKLQLGTYLLMDALMDLFADGIVSVDFLSGDSEHKRRMSNKAYQERHYYLVPRGWPGTFRANTLRVVNAVSEISGHWLEKSGLKTYIKRTVRAASVGR